MSEIRMFGLENPTKFSSDFWRLDFRHSGCSVRLIVRSYYKCPKSERSVGRVDQPNVWNLLIWILDNWVGYGCQTTSEIWMTSCLKSGLKFPFKGLYRIERHPYFGQLGTSGFQTATVCSQGKVIKYYCYRASVLGHNSFTNNINTRQ